MPQTLMNRVRSLQSHLRTRTCQQSPDPLGAFVIDCHTVGQLIPRVMSVLRQDPVLAQYLEETKQNTFRLIAPSTPSARAHTLDKVTLRLEVLGMTQQRRNEKLDILTEEGLTIAQAERSVFRTLGLSTRVVRLIAITPDGRFWLQRRSPNKSIGPGLWDNLAAGMMSEGETSLTAMIRELHEEAGIDADLQSLKPLPALDFDCQYLVPEGWMRERTASFLLTVPSEVTPTNLDGEADSFACFTVHQLLDLIEADRLMPEAARLLVTGIIARCF